MDGREYTQQRRKKRKARTVRNITVFAVLMLLLIGMFVVKTVQIYNAPESVNMQTTEE